MLLEKPQERTGSAGRCLQTTGWRRWLSVAVAGAVYAAACAPAPAPVEQKAEEPAPAPSPEPIRVASIPAVEAYVLTLDNRDRCLAIARGVQAKYRSNGGRGTKEVRTYVSSATKPDQAVVRWSRRIAWERLREVPRDTAWDLEKALEELLRAERRLCSEAISIHNSALDYQQGLDEAVFELNQALAAVERLLEVSPAERAGVLRRYRKEMEGAGVEVLNDLVAQGKPVEWQGVGVPSQERFDPEEYERKKKAWEQARERQEQERAEAAEARRRYAEERRARGQTQGGDELPRLGLAEEPRPVRPLGRSTADSSAVISSQRQARMKAWHEHYWAKTRSAKIAVSRYRQLDYEEDEARRLAVCDELHRTASRVLADGSAFSSPDRSLNELLRRTYDAWSGVAEACLAGDEAARERNAAAAESYLSKAVQALKPYNLPP